MCPSRTNSPSGTCKPRGLFRTARSALEHKIGGIVPDDHPILMWPVRHAACLHNRCHVGQAPVFTILICKASWLKRHGFHRLVPFRCHDNDRKDISPSAPWE